MGSTPNKREGRRILELDSVRGVAAAAVVAAHVAGIPKYEWGVTWDRAVSNLGYGSVVVFFVLSGFVLSLPFDRGKPRYRNFETRRIFRLYPPYFAALAVAAVVSTLVGRGAIAGLGVLFNKEWARPLTTRSLLEHATLIWSFPQYQHDLDSPIWSLVNEMRISLVFPILVVAVLWLGWKRALVLIPIVGLVGIEADRFAQHHWPNQDWFATIRYVPMFAVGILLARHRVFVAERFARLPALARGLWLPVAVCCWAATVVHSWPAGPLITDLTDTLAAAMVVVLALGSPVASRILTTRPLTFAGRISYSLYLLHLVAILAAVRLLHNDAPLTVLLPAAVVVSVALAWVSYVLVELPSIAAGRRLTATKQVGVAAGEATPP